MEAVVQDIGFSCDPYLYIAGVRKSISNKGKLANEYIYYIVNLKVLL